MPDKIPAPLQLSQPTVNHGATQAPQADSVDEEVLAKEELKRISPSNEELRKFAAKCGPLPEWLDKDEPPPF